MFRPLSAALALALVVLCSLPAGAGKPRIVSLIPSLTEDLFAIGAGSQVVGASAFTDYPASASGLPVVATFSSVDTEKVIALHPDVIVGITAQAGVVRDLRRAGLAPFLLPDETYADIFGDLATLGRLSGHEVEAAALAKHLRERTAALVARVPPGPRPRTFVVLGVAPIFTVGDRSYIARLIELAGGRNAAHDLPSAYAQYSAEALLALQPDVIVADKQSGILSVLDRAPWNALRAVREKRLYVLDDADLLERPGPRYVDGLAWLIARLHPDAAHAG
jgi:ABC-type Fe3+-hydroxamate transport system substrate-binding protein